MVDWAWQHKVEIWTVLGVLYVLLAALNLFGRLNWPKPGRPQEGPPFRLPSAPPAGDTTIALKENHNVTVVVSSAYYWEPIETVPLGCKVQLKTIPGGVATYGEVNERNRKYFSDWAPLPTTRKEPK
jgi:hypothetical protein